MNIRKIFSGQIILLSLFISFIGYTIISNFINQINQINEYKIEIASLQSQIDEVQLEINETEKSEHKTLDEIEELARESLNMVKPGEIIYIDINREGE